MGAMSTSIPSPMTAPRPYSPDGGYEVRGVVMLVSSLVVTGGALGYLAHLVSQWFYLILLFPLAIGFALGAVGAWMARSGRVRNPLIGGLAGFLGGIFAMAMMHYFDYRAFQTQQASIAADDPEFVEYVRRTPGPIERLADDEDDESDASTGTLPRPFVSPIEEAKKDRQFQLFIEAVRVRSFLDYMNFAAHQGVELKSTHGSSKEAPFNLGFAGSWIYWAVEVLIVAGVTFAVVRSQTNEPYCRACDAWRVRRPVGFFTGDLDRAAAGVRDGDVAALAAAGPDPQGGLGILTSTRCAGECAADAPEAELKLEQVVLDKKGKVASRRETAHATWPASRMAEVDALFAAPAAPATQA